MLEYDRVDIPERIDINKTNVLKECKICNGTLKILVLNMSHIFAMAVIV